MSKPITTDPNALAAVITGLGGTVIPGPTFRFDLPLSEVRTVIPKINELGLRCERVSERVEDHPTQLRCSRSVVTVALFRDTE